MDNTIYWIWLSLKKRISLKNRLELVKAVGTVKELYDTNDFKSFGRAGEAVIKDLSDKSLDKAEEIIDKMNRLGGYIVTIDDCDYPKQLLSLADAPVVLYVLGNIPDWENEFCLTVVGTRSYCDYAKKAVQEIVHQLALYNIIIVSGMAYGIDSIAADAALKAGGKTIAVLGNGVDVIYPKLCEKIYYGAVENGAVISEFPPGTPPMKFNFPRRNRILAALSKGVLVGQAPSKSGTLITAGHAIAMNRDVFVIPGGILDERFKGSNKLIQQGAKLIISAEDIIEDYPYVEFVKTERIKETEKKEVSLDGLNETEIKIVKLLCERKTHIDELSRSVGITSAELNSAMIMLEISGKVKKLDGNIYEVI